jgi:NAD-dependent SIR2 family protein deacetylase
MEILHVCINCGWKGTSDQLECDTVETCMGPDQIEMCPECGSVELKMNVIHHDE